MRIFKNNFVVGIAAGLAAAVIAPLLIPAVKKGARPLAKSLVKGGVMLYEKSREAVAEAGEMMEDVVAEVRAEAVERHAAAAADGSDEGSLSSQSDHRPRGDGNDRNNESQSETSAPRSEGVTT
jgi:hypothetical protein